jgi:hypothetical protein
VGERWIVLEVVDEGLAAWLICRLDVAERWSSAQAGECGVQRK